MRKYGVRMKDRFLAGLLAVILIIGMLPLTVMAAPEDDAQQPEQSLFVVTVKEVDENGEQAVANADLEYTLQVGTSEPVEKLTSGEGKTDQNGQLTLNFSEYADQISKGNVYLTYTVTKEGYQTATNNAAVEGDSLEITLSKDETVAPQESTISVKVTGEGTATLAANDETKIDVTKDTEDTANSLTVNMDEEVTLTVAGENASVTVQRGEAEAEVLTLTDNRANITADVEIIQITVEFAANEPQPPEETTYTVTLTTGEGGTVELKDEGGQTLPLNNGEATVAAGTALTLGVKAAEGYRVASVSIDGVEEKIGNPGSFTKGIAINADTEIVVTFVAEYTVTLTTGKGGSASLTDKDKNAFEGTTVAAGTELNLNVTPNAGYRIASVSINKVEEAIDNPSSFTKDITINTNTEIVVAFIAEYTVTLTAGEGGTAELNDEGGQTLQLNDGKATVAAGTALTLEVKAAEGYRIDGVSINGEKIDSDELYSFTKENIEVNADTKIEVTFIKEYTVTIIVGENGTVETEPKGSQNGGEVKVKVESNGKAKITAIAEEGYRVGNFTVTPEGQDSHEYIEDESDVTKYETVLENIETNIEIKVTFVARKFDVKLVENGSNENGSVSITPQSVSWHGKSVATITANKGYIVEKVTVNGEAVPFAAKDPIDAPEEAPAVEVDKAELVQVKNNTVKLRLTNITKNQDITVEYAKIDESEKKLEDITEITVTKPLRVNEIETKTENGTITEKIDLYIYGQQTNVVYFDASGLVEGICFDDIPAEGENFKDNSATINFTETGEMVKKIYLYYKNAWHAFKLSKPVTFVQDLEKPVVGELQLKGANQYNYVTNGEATVKLPKYVPSDSKTYAHDPENGGNWSGIKTVKYYIVYDDNTSDEFQTAYTMQNPQRGLDSDVDILVSMQDPATKEQCKSASVHVKVVDAAGNESDEKVVTLYNSKAYVRPNVTVNIDGITDTGTETGYYKAKQGEDSGECTVTVAVEDNADTTDLDSVTTKDLDSATTKKEDLEKAGLNITVKTNGEEIDWKPLQPEWVDSNDDSGNGTFSVKITFTEEKEYELNVTYTNKADLSDSEIVMDGVHDKNRFTLDCTSPTGSIGVKDGPIWEQLMKTLTFGLFTNKKMTFKAESNDTLSGVKETVYYKDSNAESALSEVELNKLYEAYVSSQTSEGSTETANMFSPELPTLNENEKAVIYVRIMDKAGNYTYISTTGIIYESTEGAIDFTYGSDHQNISSVGFKSYTECAKLGVSVDDTRSKAGATNQLSSGIKTITYKVEAGDDIIDNGDTNKVELNVKYTGKSKELYNVYKDLYADEYENPDLTEDERKDLEDCLEAKLKEDGVELEKLKTSWSIGSENLLDVGQIEKNASEYYQYYRVTVTVTDNAGNEYSESSDVLQLLDMPTVTLDIEGKQNEGRKNESEQNDIYYISCRVTITVSNSFNTFNENSANGAITIKKDNKDIYGGGKFIDESYSNFVTFSDSEWELIKDRNAYQKTITFNEDGKYEVEFSNYEDNGCQVPREVNTTFVKDSTAPKLGSSTPSAKALDELLEALTFGFYKGNKLGIRAKATDNVELYRADYLEVKLSETDLNKHYTADDLNNLYKGNKFKPFNNSDKLLIDVKGEDRYVFYYRVADAAGNYQYFCSDGFVIDERPSEINFEVKTKPAAGKHNGKAVYTGDVMVDVKVTEKPDGSFSGIKNVSWWVECNGKTTQEGSKDFRKENPKLEDLKADWKASITIDSKKNNNCNVVLHVKTEDNAGNENEVTQTFDIDTTPTTIEVAFDNNNAVNKKYFNGTRTATVTFTERSDHFDKDAAIKGIDIAAKDVEGKVVENAYKISDWNTIPGKAPNGETDPDKDTHKLEIQFNKDANYTFEIHYKDMVSDSRNDVKCTYVMGTVAAQNFTVDTNKPEATVYATTKEGIKRNWKDGLHDLKYDLWSRSGITITHGCTDKTSPVEVKYYKVKSNSANDNTTALNRDALDHLDDSEWKPLGINLTITNEEQFVIYLKVTDEAGNYSYVNTDGLIIDKNAPIEDLKAKPIITLSAGKEDIYNGDVRVSVDVEDPLVNGTYSGLKQVTYKISSLGKQTAEGELYRRAENNPTQQELTRTLNRYINVDSKTNNSNEVTVTVTAEDNAGNKTTEELDLSIDISAPRIEVSYDNNAADNGDYFKANRVATVTVYERNFRADLVNLTITNTDGTIPTHTGWDTIGGTGNGDDTRHVTTIVYSADGDYTFKAACTDLAGNTTTAFESGNSVAPSEFTIDKTLPIIRVDYDNNEAANGNYYKAERTATITITEHNFDANRVKITINEEEKTYNWTTSGNEHTATIRYADDARYAFDIEFTDMAGNAAADFEQQTFFVDTTMPELEITGVESANKGDVIPIVTWSDTNIDESKVRITLTGANRGSVELDGEYKDDRNGGTFTFANFPKEKEIDDIYTLSATATDKAGNTTPQQIVFTVNRFGSVYVLSDTAKPINGTYMKEPRDVVFSEINADELSNIVITLSKNGENIVLKEGEDYKIDRSGGDGQWYEYTYTIYAKNFEDDGLYSLFVQSNDKAGNVAKNDQDVKDTAIRFGVDSTCPSINIVNLESRKTYVENSYPVKMTIRDNLKLEKVIVMLDGRQHTEWSGEALDAIVKNGGNFEFNISGKSSSAHDLVVYAMDAAGNGEIISETQLPENAVCVEHFYVTTNLWVRYYTNTPLFVGSIAAVLVIAALIIVLIVRKRKKAEK